MDMAEEAPRNVEESERTPIPSTSGVVTRSQGAQMSESERTPIPSTSGVLTRSQSAQMSEEEKNFSSLPRDKSGWTRINLARKRPAQNEMLEVIPEARRRRTSTAGKCEDLYDRAKSNLFN